MTNSEESLELDDCSWWSWEAEVELSLLSWSGVCGVIRDLKDSSGARASRSSTSDSEKSVGDIVSKDGNIWRPSGDDAFRRWTRCFLHSDRAIILCSISSLFFGLSHRGSLLRSAFTVLTVDSLLWQMSALTGLSYRIDLLTLVAIPFLNLSKLASLVYWYSLCYVAKQLLSPSSLAF